MLLLNFSKIFILDFCFFKKKMKKKTIPNWFNFRLGVKTGLPVNYLYDIIILLNLNIKTEGGYSVTAEVLQNFPDEAVEAVEEFIGNQMNEKIHLFNEAEKNRDKDNQLFLKENDWIGIILRYYGRETLDDEVTLNPLRESAKKIAQNLFDYYLPTLPKMDQNGFLSVNSIYDYLEKYEMNPHFKFKMFFPIRVNEPFDFNKLSKKYDAKNIPEKYGFVINTEIYDKNKPNLNDFTGHHWVGLIFNVRKAEFHYYDPLGRTPDQNMINTLQNILDTFLTYPEIPELRDYLNKNKTTEIPFIYNDKQMQFDSINCGVYVIKFIEEDLKGIEFQKFYKIPFTYQEAQEFKIKNFNIEE